MGQEYGEPGYFDPSSGATNPDLIYDIGPSPYGSDTDVDTATDPFTGEYENEYDEAGYEGTDVGAAGMPGGSGFPLRPAGVGGGGFQRALLDQYNYPRLPPGPDVSRGQLPAAGVARGGAMSRYGAIMRHVAQVTGMRVRLATVLFLIAKIGWAAAAAATGLGAQDLLWLFIRSKTRRRGSRGPHLHTIVKRCRQAARYRAMLSLTAQQCGYGHGGGRHHRRRALPPYRVLRPRRRHRRK